MKRVRQRWTDWLESHWVTPAYSGWLLGSLSVFFFIAATNTLSGWLYVLSGIGLAMLAIAAILPSRTLSRLRVQRVPIYPVSAGDQLTVELIIENRSPHPKALIQVRDVLPKALGEPMIHSIEMIPAKQSHHWIYCHPTQRRGIYRWQTVQLRTANPLGLFWCRREQIVKATAAIYPTVLPLVQCPLIDEMGQDVSLLFNSDRRAQAATEGLTRSLRPYRWGDPTRLVHWRTSARYNELRVRELEIFTGGQELIIGLDSQFPWRLSEQQAIAISDEFEQAVIAAASLYFYACHRNLNVKLWTAQTGLVSGNQVVLETLAAVQPGESAQTTELPAFPTIWLTQNPQSLMTLPAGSRWILWAQASSSEKLTTEKMAGHRYPGIHIQEDQTLQHQLQSAPRFL